MLLIPCPHCGEDRPEAEFVYGGEAAISRPKDPASLSDAAWADYVYGRTNPKGTHFELWHHLHGCGRYIQVARDTVSNRIHGSSAAGEPLPAAPERRLV